MNERWEKKDKVEKMATKDGLKPRRKLVSSQMEESAIVDSWSGGAAAVVIESRVARAFRRIVARFEAPIKLAFIAFVGIARAAFPIQPRISALSSRVSA